MTADAHCPECGCDDRPIVLVRLHSVKRSCTACGHVAWTAKDEDPERPGERSIEEMLIRQDRPTVPVREEAAP